MHAVTVAARSACRASSDSFEESARQLAQQFLALMQPLVGKQAIPPTTALFGLLSREYDAEFLRESTVLSTVAVCSGGLQEPSRRGLAYLAAEAAYQEQVVVFRNKVLHDAPLTRREYQTLLHSDEHDDAIEQLTDSRYRADDVAMESCEHALEQLEPGKWVACVAGHPQGVFDTQKEASDCCAEARAADPQCETRWPVVVYSYVLKSGPPVFEQLHRIG